MRSVHAKASSVIVWVGETDVLIDEALDVCLPLAQPDAPDITPDHLQKIVRPVTTGIARIFRKGWWQRMWVVQEVVVATTCPTLLCGHREIKWSVMTKLRLVLIGSQWMPTNRLDGTLLHNLGVREILWIPEAWKAQSCEEGDSPRSVTLSKLLEATNRRDSTEPRDRIFALLGILDPNSCLAELPDYGMPIAEIYQRVMVHILEEDRNYAFLLFAVRQRFRRLTRQPRGDLPSWCLDFSKPGFSTKLNADDEITNEAWHRDLDNVKSTSRIDWNPKMKTIRVPGTKLDSLTWVIYRKHSWDRSKWASRLATVMSRWQSEKEIDKMRRTTQELASRALIFLPHAVLALRKRFDDDRLCQRLAGGLIWKVINSGASLQDTIMSAQLLPLLGQMHDQHLHPNDFSPIERFVLQHSAAWMKIAFRWSHLIGEPSSAWDRLLPWVFNSLATLSQYSLITTEQGLIGKADGETSNAGDELWVIHGCKAPAILRAYQGGYKLISFAWIDEFKQLLENVNDFEGQDITLF